MGLFSFLSKKASVRPSEGTTYPSNYFFGLDVARHNYDGVNAIKNGYIDGNDLYSIIQKIVNVSNGVPFIVKKKVGEVWQKDEQNTILQVINNPNPFKEYTWAQIYEMILVYLILTGDSFVKGDTGLGDNKIMSLDVLPSPNVSIRDNSRNFFLPSRVYDFTYDGRLYTYTPKELLNIKLFNPSYCTDEHRGLGVVKVASDVIQTMRDKWDASASLFQNRGVSGMVTDKSNRPMTDPETKKFQEAFNKDTAGTKKFGGVKVTNKDLQYVQMSMSAEDLQLVEQSVIGLRALCNVMGLDSSLLNDPENKTYSNRSEAEKAMYSNCIIPLSNKICDALTKFIAPTHYPTQEYKICQDFESVEVLQENKKLEAEKDKIVLEGIALILNMPLTPEAKMQLIKDTYKEITEDFLKQLQIIQTNEGREQSGEPKAE